MNENRRIIRGQGQESVWDYPRPPRLEPTPKHLRVVFNNLTIADTTQAFRVLETSHPPAYYIPPEDVLLDYLNPVSQRSLCEFKGIASYFSVKVGSRVSDTAAWCYPEPTRGFRAIRNYVAFFPTRMDACFVNGELVRGQPGDFYGGWITDDIVGPFKTAPGRAPVART